LSSDATYGAAATAWNTKVDTAAAYTGTTNVTMGSTLNQGSIFTLTTSAETKTGTAGADTFLALNSGDLGSSDIIDGAGGTDTIYSVLATTGSSATLLRPVLTSVETVQFELSDGSSTATTSTINFDKSSGVQTVTLKANAFNTAADTFAVSGVTTATSLKITDDAGAATTRANNYTMSYDGVTGSADSASVEISSTVSATELGNITVAGVETLTVSSTGGAGATYKVVGADATALTLAASALSGGTVDLAGAKIATLNINAADSVTVTDAGAASAKLRTVNIASQTADKTVTLTSLTPTMTSTAQDLVSEAFTVNVSGAGKAVITADNTQFGTQSDTNADSFVVAAGTNTGGVTVTLSSMTSAAPRIISVTGGTGNDTLAVAAGGLDNYDTVALGGGTNTLQTAIAASSSTTTSAASLYYDTTATADPTITGVTVAKIVMDGGSSNAAAGNITVDITSAAEIASIVEIDDGVLTDFGIHDLIVNNAVSGSTLNTGKFDWTDTASKIAVSVKDASTGTADSITLGLDIFETSGSADAGTVDEVEIADVESITINITTTDTDVLAATVSEIDATSATTITLNSALNITVTADGAATNTIDASAVTGTVTLNAGADKQTLKGSATKATTFTMAANLNADDSIVGGSATTDSLTATITDLTATTGKLSVTGVETLSLTNGSSGTAVVDATGIVGATNVVLIGAATSTSLTKLATGAKVTLGNGAGDLTFTGGLTVSLADATGSADSLTFDLNGGGSRGTTTLTTTGIETVVLNGDTSTTSNVAYEAQTVTMTASTAATINVTGGHATPAKITLGTLNAATTLVDASAFTGGLVATAATNTATTIKVRSSTSNDITGSVLSDTVIVGTAAVQAAADIGDTTAEIDGGVGTDTLTVYAANGADLTAADNFEIVNVIVDAAADASIDLGGSGQGADDAALTTITGGAAGKTLALSGYITDIGARTIDASGVASTTTLTLGDNVLKQTNSADALLIKGGSSAADVLAYTASNDDAGEVTISGFETIQVTNGNTESTLNLINVTGATNVTAVGAGQLIISNFGNSQKVVLGTYVGSTATVFSDGTTDSVSVSRAADGTADVLSVDLNTTATFTLTDNQAETVNLALVDTAGDDDHVLTLSSTSATNVQVTGTGTAEDLTLTASGALLTTVNASTFVGNLTYDVSNRAAQAMTITGGTGNDTIGMTFAADVLDGGTKTSDSDTLNVSFTGTGGALIIDLSSSTDQVQMFNGLANATIQKNFENVSASAYTQSNSVGADITGSDSANTITGSAYSDTIRAGKGGDTVVYSTGNDIVTLGDGNDTLNVTHAILAANSGTSATHDGGDGTDNLVLTTAGTSVADADFVGLTSIETLTIANGTNTVVTGSSAATAGIVTIQAGTGADTVTIHTAVTSYKLAGGIDVLTILAGEVSGLTIDDSAATTDNVVLILSALQDSAANWGAEETLVTDVDAADEWFFNNTTGVLTIWNENLSTAAVTTITLVGVNDVVDHATDGYLTIDVAA
jgi:S-layer protein